VLEAHHKILIRRCTAGMIALSQAGD